MIRGIDSKKVISVLKSSDENYISHYIGTSTIHNNEGDSLYEFSYRVFNNLKAKGFIERFGESELYHSEGYFKLKGKEQGNG